MIAVTPITRDVIKIIEVIGAGLTRGLGRPKPGHMCVLAAVSYGLGLPHGDKPPNISPALRLILLGINELDWPSKMARAKGLRRLAIAQLDSREIDDREFMWRVVQLVIHKTVPGAMRIAATANKDPVRKAALLDAAAQCERVDAANAANTSDVAFIVCVANAAAAAAAADAAFAAYSAAPHTAYTTVAAYAAASGLAFDAYLSAKAGLTAVAAVDVDNAAKAVVNAVAAAVTTAVAAGWAYKKAYANTLAEFAEDVVQVLITMRAPGCQFLHLTEVA